jgi:hypothetical protein
MYASLDAAFFALDGLPRNVALGLANRVFSYGTSGYRGLLTEEGVLLYGRHWLKILGERHYVPNNPVSVHERLHRLPHCTPGCIYSEN